MYCLGRIWIEALRIDEANHILGLRLNVLTSLAVGFASVSWIYRSRKAQNTLKTPENTHEIDN
jgi:prolipoprotein diacylglyceryltransferase